MYQDYLATVVITFVYSVKSSVSTDSVPPISKPGGKPPTEDVSVLTIRQILKYSLHRVVLL